MDLSVETFAPEMAAALRAYEKYVVCLAKSSEEFQASLVRLMRKAIAEFVNRGPQLRHGIALDRQLTVILSETAGERPLCGIYFNLHSPYAAKSKRPATE
jgi:hypothetical protein